MSQTISITESIPSELSETQLVHLPSRESLAFPNPIPEQELQQLGLAQITPDNGSNISDISAWRTIAIIGTVACATLLNSLLNGLLVVGLPTMARDLSLDANLLLWPSSVAA